MNVLRVTRTYPPRVCGWSAHVRGLSRQQVELGHGVDVIQPIAASHMDGDVAVRFVPRADSINGPRRHLADLAFGLRAARLTLRNRHQIAPDVIHIHGDFIDAMVFGPVGRLLGVPVVLTVHSSLNTRMRYRLAARMAFHTVDGFIAVSPQAAADLQRLGVGAGRIAQISSGVDCERFVCGPSERDDFRRSRGIHPDTLVVTFVGRLHRVKGLLTLLQAARSLPPDRFRVLIVGDGPEREVLVRAASGVAHVSLLGEVPRTEVARVLGGSDLFVMPSIDLPGHSEGTPTAVIEAMAAGLPIVASDSGGLPGIVRVGENGLLFRQGDALDLRTCVLSIANDPAARRSMARRNVEEANRRGWPNVARAVLDFYGRVGVRTIREVPRFATAGAPES